MYLHTAQHTRTSTSCAAKTAILELLKAWRSQYFRDIECNCCLAAALWHPSKESSYIAAMAWHLYSIGRGLLLEGLQLQYLSLGSPQYKSTFSVFTGLNSERSSNTPTVALIGMNRDQYFGVARRRLTATFAEP